jgi:hypothetical protein
MPKRVVLTEHARQRLRLRELREDWIISTALGPEWIEPEPRYAGAERRFRAIPEFGGRVLRVVCVETETAIRVTTATFDRSARRKR